MASDKEYIKLYRKLLENKVIFKDNDHLALWVHLLLTVNWKIGKGYLGGELIDLQPGQNIYGRKALSEKTNISESKIERILKRFESEQQIEQQTSSKNRLITIVNWSSYQNCEQQIEQQVNNKRTTSEQQVNTKEEDKNIKKNKNKINTGFTIPLLDDVISYIRENNFNVDANAFMDYYTSTGWLISGKTKMKDWKSTVRNWDRRNANKKNDTKKQERPEKSYGVTI